MGVYIKGMEMQKSCCSCPFEESINFCYGKMETCPLIPIPPHGRLIDADALVADLKGQVERLFNLDAVSESDFFIERNEKFRQAMWKNWCESFYEYLSTRPTIIEAEEVSE